MDTNSFFNINRLKYFLIRQISINYKTWLIAAGSVAGFLMFIGTWNIFFDHHAIDSGYILGIVLPVFFITGLIYTSLIFSELNSTHRAYLYFSIPASAFEKLLSAWLLSSIMYVLFGIILIYIVNFYYILVAGVFTSKTVELVNLFNLDVLKTFGTYMVIQSIFFLGAIYFRRVNFLKTLLAGFVFMVIISIYSGLLLKLLFGSTSLESKNFVGGVNIAFTAEFVIIPIAKYLFWLAIAPFFLIVSYFRLKERQV